MKKVSLFLGMVLAASFAIAQNKALVEQVGSTNGATVSQSGANDVTVRQLADKNTAQVSQTNAYGIAYKNVGVVLQLKGNENSATLIQNGYGNKANLYQGIIAGYAQSGTVAMAANYNTGFVRQVGNSNDVYDFFQLGDQNTGSVDILGNSNRVEFQQGFTNYDSGDAVWSNRNNSAVNITGSSNFVGMWQWGNDNTSNITQNGSSNNAAVFQGYSYRDQGIAFVPDATGNVSNVSQQGSSNNVRAAQLGDYNTISLTQNGNGNKVGGPGTGLATYFRQTGDGNQFYGVQTDGATLEATSGQTGNYDYINMSQGASDNAEIIQAGGDSNKVWLTQGGGGQDATILQTGSNNTASVSQGL